ncbi:MAG: hypothetical protein GY939_14125, partial [Actinomycetia bacterium]|nr:hypothetical protein [Actinomycetes bacterium]
MYIAAAKHSSGSEPAPDPLVNTRASRLVNPTGEHPAIGEWKAVARPSGQAASSMTNPRAERSSSLERGRPEPLLPVWFGRGLLVVTGGLIVATIVAIALGLGPEDTRLDTTAASPTSNTTGSTASPETSELRPALKSYVGSINPALLSASTTITTNPSTPATHPASSAGTDSDTTTSGDTGSTRESSSPTSSNPVTAAPPTLTSTGPSPTPTGPTTSQAEVPTSSSATLPSATASSPTEATSTSTSSTTNTTTTPSSTTTDVSTTTTTETTTTVGGGPVVSGGVWDYYGNPWVPSDLANLTLQGGERFSYRFVAKHT